MGALRTIVEGLKNKRRVSGILKEPSQKSKLGRNTITSIGGNSTRPCGSGSRSTVHQPVKTGSRTGSGKYYS